MEAAKLLPTACFFDHLPDGRWESKISDELREQTRTVPKKNIGPEHIFGCLDRYRLMKPNATTGHHEGVITYNVNKSGQWLLQQADQTSIINNAVTMGRQLAKTSHDKVESFKNKRREMLSANAAKKQQSQRF